MDLEPVEKWKECVELERRRLAAGERPKPLFSNGVQRAAARGLCVFLALMAVLTLLSRAADGITVAQVQAQNPKTGILTQRVTVNGNIEPLGDLVLSLPSDVLVNTISAETGQQVKAGDVLMTLDDEALRQSMEKLENELAILELKIANTMQGTSGDSTDGILEAEQALEEAREDYDRLSGSAERSETRAAEDLETARADYEEALAGLKRAEEKARNQLVKTAEDELEAAEKALGDAEDAARTAVEAAEESLTAAQDAQKAYSKQYYESVRDLKDLRSRLNDAQRALEALIEAGAGEEELQAARTSVEDLQSAVETADWSMESYNYGSDLAVTRAEEALEKARARQEEKLQAAEAERDAAEKKLEEARARTDVGEEELVLSAQAAVESAEKALRTAERAAEDAGIEREEKLLSAARTVESAQRALEQARRKAEEERQSGEAGSREREAERLGYVSQQRETRQLLEQLKAVEAAGGRLTAPVDGTVASILSQPGRTQEGAQAAVLTRNDQGFAFRGKLDQKKAEDLAAGDQGKLTFTLEGKAGSAEAIITSVGAADSQGQVTVTAQLPEGNYGSGGSAELEISRRSQQYDMVLPLSALRMGGGDAYVLVIQEKQSVMGVEQTVVKKTVILQEQDSENMAVEGALLESDQVVISSNKPVEEGDRVRLETTNE
ncbi:HlyD family efflux transporter periplasmic adaptor subunit [Intestinimonas sp. RTP31139st1_F5_RTP31139_211217]|uniref:HlyD family efflux transporter periplasmic adaptor subunit n=1 Tax=Intestinimonas sp. RTP31139st1_F5_RTP31139_211217 TaxID=3143190 RepID=UPI0032EF0285